jgi:hypothetical protein
MVSCGVRYEVHSVISKRLASLEGLTSTPASFDVLRPAALQSGTGSGQKHTCITLLQDSLLHTHCTPDEYVLFIFEMSKHASLVWSSQPSITIDAFPATQPLPIC